MAIKNFALLVASLAFAEASSNRAAEESCLFVVRKVYSDGDVVQTFAEEHPTDDKSTLVAKIFSQMMIECQEIITPDQVKALEVYKYDTTGLDSAKYANLVAIDWEALKFKGDYNSVEARASVGMTQLERQVG